jgi:DNA-binding HxlR family transcriptional regulator
MTDLERNLRAAILRALLAAKGPMPESALKQHLRNVFAHVAFTDGDLTQRIRELETAGIICGTDDEIVGTVWDLTLRGKTRAQQL